MCSKMAVTAATVYAVPSESGGSIIIRHINSFIRIVLITSVRQSIHTNLSKKKTKWAHVTKRIELVLKITGRVSETNLCD